MEMTIAAGFENMVDRHADVWLTKDAISFNCAMWTKECVTGNKIPGRNERCDIYVYGFVDGAIDFLRLELKGLDTMRDCVGKNHWWGRCEGRRRLRVDLLPRCGLRPYSTCTHALRLDVCSKE